MPYGHLGPAQGPLTTAGYGRADGLQAISFSTGAFIGPPTREWQHVERNAIGCNRDDFVRDQHTR